jgi:hypothetical protein
MLKHHGLTIVQRWRPDLPGQSGMRSRVAPTTGSLGLSLVRLAVVVINLGNCTTAAIAGEATCQDGHPDHCCPQWEMEIFGLPGKSPGLLIDNSYRALIADRDRSQGLNQSLCARGDKSSCGITYGAARCWGAPAATNTVKGPKQESQCDALANMGEREICEKIASVRERCQDACTQWDTVNAKWVCFSYNPRPLGCPQSVPVRGMRSTGGTRD